MSRRRPRFETLESRELLTASTVDSWVMPVVFNDAFFYAAADSEHGTELWKSDGTEQGTALLKDLRAGTSGSEISQLTPCGSTLFFTANDGSKGVELWKTNGTASGTVLVKDICSGTTGSSPTELTVMGNAVFFAANNGTNGTELWKTDGTSGGTVLVADIRNGVNGSNPGRFAVVGNTLYFTASDGASGIELWKSNGTTGGTTLVKDIRPGSVGSNPIHLTPYKEQLLFAASDEYDANQLFKSNGTESDTSRVTPYKIRPTAKIANTTGLSVREGCSLQLSATGSTDPVGEGLVYLWDFQNTGKYTEYQNSTVWFDAEKLNGKPSQNQAIRLKVRDAEGTESEVVTANVSILDVMPTYQVSQPSELVAGRFAQWEFAANDTASDPIMKWAINWGDGSETVVNGGPLSRIFDTHFYRESKSYTITIKTTDIDGVESSAKLGIYVKLPPAVQQAASHEIPAAELYTHNADYSSKSWEDTTIAKTNADDTMRLRQMLDLDQSRESKAATSVVDFIWADDGSLFVDWIDFANEWDSYERTDVFEEELLKDLVLIG